MGAGGWGYIASGHDGAGTVAFVTAGTVAGLLGIIGRVLTRLLAKDYGVDMSEEEIVEKLKAGVAEAVEDLPASAKEEIVKAGEEKTALLGWASKYAPPSQAATLYP